MYKGTPGPWSINTGARNQQFIRAARADDLKYIARIHPMGSGVAYHDGDEPEVASEEAKANANLIAAAPDLSAALEDMILLRDQVLRMESTGDELLRVSAARAAIAKARGE